MNFIKKLLKPRGKYAFVLHLKDDASILDVGCGNNSPYWTKQILPHCFYTGIDIGDYAQTAPNLSDRYLITSPEEFASEIAKNKNCFDAVICAHNLEHCNDREKTLQAIIDSLKNGGLLYIAFPTAESVNFPSRGGCLNYYDDHTHTGTPPCFDTVMNMLEQNNFEIVFSTKSYKPFVLWMLGLLTEPFSRQKNYNTKFTWSYYGFESVIWARKQGCKTSRN